MRIHALPLRMEFAGAVQWQDVDCVLPEHRELVDPLTIELALKTPAFIGITPIR
jgi:hypothetical protein